MAGPVTLEYNGRIAIITIDDQKKLNALTQDGYYQLASYMREVATHDEVFVTVLTGKGTYVLTIQISEANCFRTILFCVSVKVLMAEFIAAGLYCLRSPECPSWS